LKLFVTVEPRLGLYQHGLTPRFFGTAEACLGLPGAFSASPNPALILLSTAKSDHERFQQG